MEDRNWMYQRGITGRRQINPKFVEGVEEFLNFAYTNPLYVDIDRIRCPCTRCKNGKFDVREQVTTHLYSRGFVPNYFVWTSHGERHTRSKTRPESSSSSHVNPYQDTVRESKGLPPITTHGLFDETHRATRSVDGGVQKGDLICPRAKRIDAVYKGNYSEKYGPDVDIGLHDDSNLFSQSCASVNPRGQHYSQPWLGRYSSGSRGGPSNHVLMEELERQKVERERQRMETERHAKEMQDMKQQIELMMGMIRNRGPPSE